MEQLVEGLVQTLEKVQNLQGKTPSCTDPSRRYLWTRIYSHNLSIIVRELKSWVIGSKRFTQTAVKGGSIIVLRFPASLVKLCPDKMSRVVIFTIFVARELSHPLGQHEACMACKVKRVQLKMDSSITQIATSKVSLSRIEEVITVLKQQVVNFFLAEEDPSVDLCVNVGLQDKVDDEVLHIPVLYPAPTASVLFWHQKSLCVYNTLVLHQTQTESVLSGHQESLGVHNIPVLHPVQTESVLSGHQESLGVHHTTVLHLVQTESVLPWHQTIGKPGQRKPLPVEYGTVLLFPQKTNTLLNSKMLFAHPKAYQRDNKTCRIVMTNLSYVKLPSGCNLGSIAESQADHTPKANASGNPSAERSNETELTESRAYINMYKTLKRDKKEILSQGEVRIRKEIVDILQNFDVGSISDSDFVDTKLMRYTIDLIPWPKPIRSKFRPLSPIREKALQRQTNARVKAEVIKPSTITLASLGPLEKEGSDKFRSAKSDHRLYKAIIKDEYPLASLECDIHKVTTAEVFSKLDSALAVQAMPIREEDRAFTAFVTPWGDPLCTGLSDPQDSGVPDPQDSGVPDPMDSGGPDSLNSGVPDSLDTGVPDSQDSGVPDPMDSGVPDSLNSGVPDSLDTGVPDPMDFGVPDSLNSGAPDSLDAGVSDPMDSGVQGFLNSGVPDSLDAGVPDPLDAGVPVPLDARVAYPQGFRVPDLQGFRGSDPQGSQVPDPQGLRVPDPQGCRVPDPQGSRILDPLNMIPNLNECNIIRKEVKYLGHLVNPSYVDHIMDWLNQVEEERPDVVDGGPQGQVQQAEEDVQRAASQRILKV